LRGTRLPIGARAHKEKLQHPGRGSGEGLVQVQAPPQRQRQIYLPELAYPLHAHAAHIHFTPARRDRLGRQTRQGQLARRGRATFQQRIDILPAATYALVQSGQLAQRRDRVLARPARRSPRFHQRPVLVGPARDGPPNAPQIHRAHARSENGF